MNRHSTLVTTVVILAVAAFGLAACGAGTTTSTPPPARSPSPRTTTVVGLGDSVMAGTRCDCDGPVAEYAEAMRPLSTRPITDVNLGGNGGTTTTLLAQLRQDTTKQAVASARAVLVIIGANDLLPQLRKWQDTGCPVSCYQPAVAAMGQRVGQTLEAIDQLRPHTRGVVLVADYWNVFPDGDAARSEGGQAQVDWSRAVSRAANAEICAAARRAEAICVDTYTPFVGNDSDPTDLLASDGDHPNAKGEALLVKQLVDATPAGTFD